MDKKTNKKMKILVAAAAVLIVLAVCFLILGGKRDDVMIEDFSVSADGSEMTLKAGIAGSVGISARQRCAMTMSIRPCWWISIPPSA